MKRSIHVFLGILLAAAGGVLTDPAAGSDDSPAAVRLEDCVQAAKSRNPDILAAKAEWLAAKERVWIDSALPDPVAGFDVMGKMVETRVGPQDRRFSVMQEIPFPLKLWERGQAAGDDAKALHQRYLAVERDVVRQITVLYYELYFADASIGVIEETGDLLKKVLEVAQTRYASRASSQRDVAKAQAEASMSLENLYKLRQARESVAAMIHWILDQDPMSPLGQAAAPEEPILTYSLMELVNLAVEHRQEIKEAEALVSKSGHNQRLAQLAYFPDLNVGFEYTRVEPGTTTEPMDGRDSWMVPLRFSVPVWQNRIVPALREAGEIHRANQARLLGAKNKAFFEVKDAYYRYDAARKIADLYETAVIPQAQLALSSDQAGYEANQGDFLYLLDSERVYLNARLSRIQFTTEMLKAHADLVRATGLDLPETGEKGV